MPVTAVFVIMAMVPSVRNPAFPSSFGVGRSEWIVDYIHLWRFKLDHDRFRIFVLNVGVPILKPAHHVQSTDVLDVAGRKGLAVYIRVATVCDTSCITSSYCIFSEVYISLG